MAVMVRIKDAVVDLARSLVTPDHQLSSRQRWVYGLVNLASVVVFWVLSSFLVSDLLESDSYRKPFFITYINTSCFCFYLIPYLKFHDLSISEFVARLRLQYHQSHQVSYHRVSDDDELQMNSSAENVNTDTTASTSPDLAHSPVNTDTTASSTSPDLAHSSHRDYGSNDHLSALGASSTSSKHTSDNDDANIINILETCKLSLQFILLWFSANLVTNASLSYTSVASQTILSSTASFFTLIVGYICSIEKINSQKVIGIILSFIGVVIVTRIDTSSPTNDPPADNDPNNTTNKGLLILWGNLLALSGALIYGIYTILLKFKTMIPNQPYKERHLNTHLFFGFVGVYCLVFVWPFIIVLHFTGLETFELPPSWYVMSMVLLNAVITFISDFCWCKAVLLTSPLTVTVGLSMTIPLAMVGDWLVRGFEVHYAYLCGAVIVTIGFLIINKDEKQDFVDEDE